MKNTLLIAFCLWQSLCISPGYGQSGFAVSYQQNAAVSDKVGNPRNSTVFYFPAERFIDSVADNRRVPKEKITASMLTDTNYIVWSDSIVLERYIRAQNDTFKLKWFSYDLFRLNEPVLYNYPLQKEVYRLTWLRSFHPPVVVRLEKEGNRVTLITKVLKRMPEYPGYSYTDRDGTTRLADTTSAIPFKVNTSRSVSEGVYEQFIQLLTQHRLLNTSPLGVRYSFGGDGSNWILEAHRPEGYYFVTRWSPRDETPLRLIGDYLLNVSDAKDERRY